MGSLSVTQNCDEKEKGMKEKRKRRKRERIL